MTPSSPDNTEIAPIRRILVATDFSPAARLAVSRAAQLARQSGARLHLVHAQPDWNLFSRSGSAKAQHYQALLEHADRGLSEELQFVETTYAIQPTSEARSGRASSVLRATIAEFSPHLIVIGTRGEHEASTYAPPLGGTALKLTAFATCPVLLVRNAVTRPYASSVAAIESPGQSAMEIIRWARTLAPEKKCHVVHAFDAPYIARLQRRGLPAAAIAAITEEAQRAAAQFASDILQSCGASGLSTHLLCGEPVAAILEELQRVSPDVAVIAKHGHAPRDELSLSIGSVALRIAYHATCDVLVVPG